MRRINARWSILLFLVLVTDPSLKFACLQGIDLVSAGRLDIGEVSLPLRHAVLIVGIGDFISNILAGAHLILLPLVQLC